MNSFKAHIYTSLILLIFVSLSARATQSMVSPSDESCGVLDLANEFEGPCLSLPMDMALSVSEERTLTEPLSNKEALDDNTFHMLTFKDLDADMAEAYIHKDAQTLRAEKRAAILAEMNEVGEVFNNPFSQFDFVQRHHFNSLRHIPDIKISGFYKK